jgi:hypothetical protein
MFYKMDLTQNGVMKMKFDDTPEFKDFVSKLKAAGWDGKSPLFKPHEHNRLYYVRCWLEAAISNAGGEVTGAGMGLASDIGLVVLIFRL